MPILILVVIVIIIGVAVALRGAKSEQAALSGSSTLGFWCLVCGLAAAVGAAMIGQATYGWVSGFDLPGWLRIVTFWMLPVGVIACAILGALSLKRHSGRRLGITGLALAVLAVGGFFAMLMAVDY